MIKTVSFLCFCENIRYKNMYLTQIIIFNLQNPISNIKARMGTRLQSNQKVRFQIMHITQEKDMSLGE